jgi:hypothetical protein
MKGNIACDWDNIYINGIFKTICEANPLLLWGGDYVGSFKDYDHCEYKNWLEVKAGTLTIQTYQAPVV